MDQAAHDEDTIVAISTASGTGAIGVVRMSGAESTVYADRAFRSAAGRSAGSASGFSLSYGHVVDPQSGAIIDEALLAVMRGPRSYTREDVVEFQCHGGSAAARAILRVLVGLGARIAGPGEFTRRAFMNGRIDLTQAESIASIVSARSSGALRVSVRQLQGGLSERVRAARGAVVQALAWIEANVDFSDEDLEEVDWKAVGDDLGEVERELDGLLRTAMLGRALDLGVRTAIVGRPNVGKSSLLNALLARDRAIVSEDPGTTRDTIEDMVEVEGVPFCLVDTAGLRVGTGQVEELGIERARSAMRQADLVLMVFDLSAPWEEADAEIVRGADDAILIVVGNKVDLVEDEEARLAGLKARVLAALPGGLAGGGPCEGDSSGGARDEVRGVLGVSALTGKGMEGLREVMAREVVGDGRIQLEEPILTNERQRVLVGEALSGVREALVGIAEGRGEELICEDLRVAAGALGRMTGEELTADLVEEIFGRFCVGK